jgi:Ca2+-binding RTX toxin-like protein
MIIKTHAGTVGNDTLTGVYLTADLFSGSLGNDTYIIQDAEDSIQEKPGMGMDTVKSAINYTLGADLENLILTGDAWNGSGNELNNVITGNLLIANLLFGFSGNDILTGGAGNDTLIGDEGNDRLTGGAGNDILNGGAGNDILNGGTGVDQMMGEAGNDTYYVDDFSDIADESYGSGTDKIISSVDYSLGYGIENLTLAGNAIHGGGNDLNNTIIGNSVADSELHGLWGNDILTGGAGNDTLKGDEGNDRLTGGVGFDHLNGGTGNDILNGGAGQDYMNGGTGNDTYYVDELNEFADEYSGDGIDKVISSVNYYLSNDIENLALTGNATHGFGNELNNVITGNSLTDSHLSGFTGNDALTGGAGNDALTGDEGNDQLTGGSGNDFLNGGNGNDTLNGGLGMDQMMGGTGNDTYYVNEAGEIADEYFGGGIDNVISSIDYNLSDAIENLTLTGDARLGYGNQQDNIIVGNSLIMNSLWGHGGDDILTGGADRDELMSHEGDDRLSGGRGVDFLDGGDGDDTLNGGADDDYMLGGLGNDTYYVDSTNDMVYEISGNDLDTVISSIDYSLGSNTEKLMLTGNAIRGSGNELDNSISANLLNTVHLYGYAGDDTLTSGAGNDDLDGGEGDDRLTAGAGHDFLDGGVGDDSLSGGDGNDMIIGGKGQDAINGGAGNDQIFANEGDFLTGGLGMDIFDGNLSDSTLRDFQKGTDLIRFDVYTYTPTHTGKFTFIGQQAFTDTDQLRFEKVGTSGILYGNVEGDLAADFQVTLTGVTSIDITDLQLQIA